MGLLVEGMKLDVSKETLEGRLGCKIEDERALTVEGLRRQLEASIVMVTCTLRSADLGTIISELFPVLSIVTFSCDPFFRVASMTIEVGGEWGLKQSQFLSQYALKPPLEDDCASYITFGFPLID